jgi:phage gpG-like protein
MKKACLLVENDAKRNCPVDTGRLRQSITHRIEGSTGIVGTNVEYAPYVEYGTGKHALGGNGRKTPWAYTD